MRAACMPDEEFRVLNLIRNHENIDRADLLIVIGMKEEGDPHFHIFRNSEDLYHWRNGSALFFNKNSYYIHGMITETLSEEEFNAVIDELKKNKNDNQTYWEYMIYLWNVCNPGNELHNSDIFEYDYQTLNKYIQPPKENKKKSMWELI